MKVRVRVIHKNGPKPRGLAAMSPEKRREIQSKGGKKSPGNFRNLPPHLRAEFGANGGRKGRK